MEVQNGQPTKMLAVILKTLSVVRFCAPGGKWVFVQSTSPEFVKMDFDLFELDEDDDILSSVYLEPTQAATLKSEIIAEFQCSGEDSLKAQFSADGFIKNAFLDATSVRNLAVEALTLGAYEFNAVHLHVSSNLRYIFGEACMNLQHLVCSVRGGAMASNCAQQFTHYQRRRQITLLLHLLLQQTEQAQWPLLRTHLASLRRLLNACTTLDTWKLLYFANSCKGNECTVPAYHLLHGALEWKWLDLCILQKYDLCTQVASEDADNANTCFVEFQAQLLCVFEDLLSCSLLLYAKKRSPELLFSTPFPCTCFKEFWLLLQLALPKWALSASSAGIAAGDFCFWTLFNKALLQLNNKMADFSLNSLSFHEFSNWVLHGLVRLHGYRSNGQFEGANYTRATAEYAENYDFTVQCTQQFLNANPSEEQLRIYICLFTPTLLQWWRPRVNIPMLLWEHYHKRLNSSFYIAGAAPANLAVACGTGRAYLDKYRALLAKVEQQQQPDANLSSYTLFTLLLGKSLARLLQANLGNQAQKLLGRIYAKFSLQKFLTLSELGIHHLTELFLVLALCGDFVELAPKLREKLLSIAYDKVPLNKQVAVAKAHMALLILHAEQRLQLGDYVTKLLQQLASVRNEVAISKVMADALLDIYTAADDFQRGEALLIDAWLPSYLQTCTPAEQERAFEALHLIFEKLQQHGHYSDDSAVVLKALHMHILPFIKQQYVSNFSTWLPKLAADFCIYAHNNRAVPATAAQSFDKHFAYFSAVQTANRQATPQFLLQILACEKSAPLVLPTVVMQVWLRSLVLLNAQNEAVSNLTKHVVQLPDFHFMSHLVAEELLQAKEPLCVFIAAVGKRYDACTADFIQQRTIADSFNAYLRDFEKWLQLDIKLEKAEVSFRFYSFLAFVIYNCPHIVYTKSKLNCFFHVALTRFVLPTSIQMGKPPDSKLAQLIHKIWPVLVQGVGRLNFKSDAYIAKTLNDLIQKWTPHFKISPNAKIVARPYITCLQGENLALSLFIFEKLTTMFLATQRRQADAHACLVVTIFQEVVVALDGADNVAMGTRQLETFMKGTCLLTLEHIMMVDDLVPSRNMLLEFYKRLLNSTVYRRSTECQQLLAEHLRILTKKHLAYYTFFYFELLMKLAQISYALVEQIMDFLLAEVRVVEQKRGAGEDNRIRGCVQQLQQCIATAKRNNL